MAYQANACGIVRDLGFYLSTDPLPTGIDQDGCDIQQLQVRAAASRVLVLSALKLKLVRNYA